VSDIIQLAEKSHQVKPSRDSIVSAILFNRFGHPEINQRRSNLYLNETQHICPENRGKRVK
jgi:hypothetical protein